MITTNNFIKDADAHALVIKLLDNKNKFLINNI